MLFVYIYICIVHEFIFSSRVYTLIVAVQLKIDHSDKDICHVCHIINFINDSFIYFWFCWTQTRRHSFYDPLRGFSAICIVRKRIKFFIYIYKFILFFFTLPQTAVDASQVERTDKHPQCPFI